jgi:hypothetical protein
LQLGMEVGAFVPADKSKLAFAAFEAAAVLAAEIGKQCGGWQQRSKARALVSAADAPPRSQVGPHPPADRGQA